MRRYCSWRSSVASGARVFVLSGVNFFARCRLDTPFHPLLAQRPPRLYLISFISTMLYVLRRTLDVYDRNASKQSNVVIRFVNSAQTLLPSTPGNSVNVLRAMYNAYILRYMSASQKNDDCVLERIASESVRVENFAGLCLKVAENAPPDFPSVFCRIKIIFIYFIIYLCILYHIKNSYFSVAYRLSYYVMYGIVTPATTR